MDSSKASEPLHFSPVAPPATAADFYALFVRNCVYDRPGDDLLFFVRNEYIFLPPSSRVFVRRWSPPPSSLVALPTLEDAEVDWKSTYYLNIIINHMTYSLEVKVYEKSLQSQATNTTTTTTAAAAAYRQISKHKSEIFAAPNYIRIGDEEGDEEEEEEREEEAAVRAAAAGAASSSERRRILKQKQKQKRRSDEQHVIWSFPDIYFTFHQHNPHDEANPRLKGEQEYMSVQLVANGSFFGLAIPAVALFRGAVSYPVLSTTYLNVVNSSSSSSSSSSSTSTKSLSTGTLQSITSSTTNYFMSYFKRNAASSRDGEEGGAATTTTTRPVSYLMLRGPKGKGKAKVSIINDSNDDYRSTISSVEKGANKQKASSMSIAAAASSSSSSSSSSSPSPFLNISLIYVRIGWEVILADLNRAWLRFNEEK